MPIEHHAASPHRTPRMVVRIGVVGCLALMVGCATVRRGERATILDAEGHVTEAHVTPGGLAISGGEMPALASKHFGFIEFTFENTSEHWIRIERVSLRFSEPDVNRDVRMLAGDELTSWQRATLERLQIRAANTESVLGLIAVAGAATHALSQDRDAAAVGGEVKSLALAALVAEHASAGANAAQLAAAVPDTHIMNVPFSVPPGLFTRRWVVLDTSARAGLPCLKLLLLDYETDKAKHERAWLHLRRIDTSSTSTSSPSEWQPDACAS